MMGMPPREPTAAMMEWARNPVGPGPDWFVHAKIFSADEAFPGKVDANDRMKQGVVMTLGELEGNDDSDDDHTYEFRTALPKYDPTPNLTSSGQTKNLFYVCLLPNELPSYHFWANDGDGVVNNHSRPDEMFGRGGPAAGRQQLQFGGSKRKASGSPDNSYNKSQSPSPSPSPPVSPKKVTVLRAISEAQRRAQTASVTGKHPANQDSRVEASSKRRKVSSNTSPRQFSNDQKHSVLQATISNLAKMKTSRAKKGKARKKIVDSSYKPRAGEEEPQEVKLNKRKKVDDCTYKPGTEEEVCEEFKTVERKATLAGHAKRFMPEMTTKESIKQRTQKVAKKSSKK